MSEETQVDYSASTIGDVRNAAEAAETQRDKALDALEAVINAKDKAAAGNAKGEAEAAVAEAKQQSSKATAAAQVVRNAPAKYYVRRAEYAVEAAETAHKEAEDLYQKKPGKEPEPESPYDKKPGEAPGRLEQQLREHEERLQSLEAGLHRLDRLAQLLVGSNSN